MKRLLTTSIFFFLFYIAGISGQDSIRYRVIFIGDAGEINDKQQTVIPQAAAHVIAGKTTVMYLGDNVYPRGMDLPGSGKEERTREILRSQFAPMRGKGAPVYFIPGNHDWDKMGKQGLAKIKEQGRFLAEQNDPLLKMVPPDGCPDPIEINLTDSLTIIAFDSEWWLFPYDKVNPDADCDCNNEKEILEKMELLLYKNRHKVILLADHHPFQSYGVHGGKYSWKEHLFPFTSLNKNLYIPLPVIGSLYPLLRTSVFINPEDMNHPQYKHMIDRVNKVFGWFPNLVHVSGHEHGLQLIKDKQIQVVSGSGAKHSFTKKGRHSLFADADQGFVTIDLLKENNIRITFYIYTDHGVTEAYSYTKPYESVDKLMSALAEPTAHVDSMTIRANPKYDRVGRIQRVFFGENYRKEWDLPTTVPVIRVSDIAGGLTPLQLGGGMQSNSLRLADKTGKEWIIRSVNKNPDPLLPEDLRHTFVRDWLDDGMSAQHPYSALIVPPIADAVKVPHANPVIGIIAADTALGVYSRTFANTLCLFEEREPLGKSDNSFKMLKNLVKDNDNSFKAKTFFRSRMLDLLIGDWDRHEDQWRWNDAGDGKEKLYIGVPRDRDQVFHLTEGIVPTIASQPWVYPMLQGFEGKITSVRYSLFKTKFINPYPGFQIGHEEWTKMVSDFVEDVTDSVLESGLQRLPPTSYEMRHDELLEKLKQRRANLPEAMESYYRFINEIVDIRATDKNELISIADAPDGGTRITIRKINKDGDIKSKLMEKTYDPRLTREIRIYVEKGDDSVVVNAPLSGIKIRIIGGKGHKSYNIIASKRNILLYDRKEGSTYYGATRKLKPNRSDEEENTAFVPVSLYNVIMPLITAGYNVDDGLMLGGGFKFTQQKGFRKTPYSSTHQLLVSAAFATGAFKIKYKADWLHVWDNTDFTLDAKALAPDNTQNFFGLGNGTAFEPDDHGKSYYRARFGLYQLDPGFRWRSAKNMSLTIGPSLQYYRFDAEDNEGRFIHNTGLIHSYDSATIGDDKVFGGIVLNFIKDTRNSKVLPSSGGYLNVKVQGYAGLNNYSKSFAQVIPEMAIYKSIDRNSNIVISDRVGGGITVGKAAFYQSLFLGGHENLLGYRQYRFAGEYMLYNNLELRVRIAQISNYILPGQLGMVFFYDAGKVWADGYNTDKVHQGIGGGLYYAPAQMAVLQFVAGYSEEGWYPYFTLGFRF